MRIDAVPVAAEILEGQVTWPVPRDALSRSLEERDVAWGGHSTEEKHERMQRFAESLVRVRSVKSEKCGFCGNAKRSMSHTSSCLEMASSR